MGIEDGRDLDQGQRRAAIVDDPEDGLEHSADVLAHHLDVVREQRDEWVPVEAADDRWVVAEVMRALDPAHHAFQRDCRVDEHAAGQGAFPVCKGLKRIDRLFRRITAGEDMAFTDGDAELLVSRSEQALDL